MGYVGFAAYLVSGVGVFASAWTRGRVRDAAALVFNLVFVVVLTAYVFGEDDYVGNGSSRWSNRASGPHALYAAVTAVAVALAVVYARAAGRRGSVFPRAGFILNGLGILVFGYFVLFAFDND